MNKNIHFILTGGTIDSIFDPTHDSVVINDHSVILEYISSKIHPHIRITTETLTLKDSRDITDNIRQEMVRSIEKSAASSIIVTHGTYTMAETASYLAKNITEKNKTVVLTGSMFPIKGFSESDAPFNLGFAIAAAQLLEPNVYVAMNSHIFMPADVVKDIETAKFRNK